MSSPLGDTSSTQWSFFEHEQHENVSSKSFEYFNQVRKANEPVSAMNVEPLMILAKDLPVTISKRHVKVCKLHTLQADAVYSPILDDTKKPVVEVDSISGQVQKLDLNGRVAGHKFEQRNRDANFLPSDQLEPDIFCECGCTYIWDCQTPDIRTVLGNMALLTNHSAYISGGGRKSNTVNLEDSVTNNSSNLNGKSSLPPSISWIGFAPSGQPLSLSLMKKLKKINCYAVPIPLLWRQLFENILCNSILLPVMHGIIPNPTLLSHCTLTNQYAYSSVTEEEKTLFTTAAQEANEFGKKNLSQPQSISPLPALPSSTEGVMQGWGRDMVVAMKYIKYILNYTNGTNCVEPFPTILLDYIKTSPTLQSLLIIDDTVESQCSCCDPNLHILQSISSNDANIGKSDFFPTSLFPMTSLLECKDPLCECSTFQRTLDHTRMNQSGADFSLLHSYTHTTNRMECARIHAHTCTPMSILALVWPAMTAVIGSVTYAATCLSSSSAPTIWIHSYPFMLAPLFLRTAFPYSRLMLSLHTPFPPSDVFKVLAWRKAILDSALKVDAVCFHTYDYARHFLAACQRVLEADAEKGDSNPPEDTTIHPVHEVSSMSLHFTNPANTWISKASTDVLATQHTAIVALGNGKLGLEHKSRTISVLNAHVGIRWRELRYLSLGGPAEWFDMTTQLPHTCGDGFSPSSPIQNNATLPPIFPTYPYNNIYNGDKNINNSIQQNLQNIQNIQFMPSIFVPPPLNNSLPIVLPPPAVPKVLVRNTNMNTPPSNPQNIPSLKSLSVPNLQELLLSCNIDHTDLQPVSTQQQPAGTNVPPVLNQYNISSKDESGVLSPIVPQNKKIQGDITSLLACRMKQQQQQQPIPVNPMTCPVEIQDHKVLQSITSCSPLHSPHLVLAAYDQSLRNRPDQQKRTTLVVVQLPILNANFSTRFDIAKNLQKYQQYANFNKEPPNCQDLHALSQLYSPCVRNIEQPQSKKKTSNPFKACVRCSKWDTYTRSFYARVQVLKRRYGENSVKVIEIQPSTNTQHSYCFTDDNAFTPDVCRRANNREEVRYSALQAQKACNNNNYYQTSTHSASHLPHEACSPLCSHWRDPFELACECKHAPFLSSWNIVNSFGLMKTADIIMTTALSEGQNLACLEATAAQCVEIHVPKQTSKMLSSISKDFKHLGNQSTEQLNAIIYLTEGHQLKEHDKNKKKRSDFTTEEIRLVPHPILPQQPAMMITSEFQALSRSLAGVFRINPWSHSDFSNAISKCLQATSEEKWNAYNARAHHASTHTFTYWSNACLSQLNIASERNTFANTQQEKHNITRL